MTLPPSLPGNLTPRDWNTAPPARLAPRLLNAVDVDAPAIRTVAEQVRATVLDLARTIQDVMRPIAAMARKVSARLREAANDEVYVAGMCARYQVRAGLDPAYATPEALDRLLDAILHDREEEVGLTFMSLENRSLVAGAAARGWAESYGRDPAPGCCAECEGTGVGGYGLCWDCRGTGHPHPGPCSESLPWHRLIGDQIVRVTSA